MKEPLAIALQHAHNTQTDFKKHVNYIRTKVGNQTMGRLSLTRNKVKAFKIISMLHFKNQD